MARLFGIVLLATAFLFGAAPPAPAAWKTVDLEIDEGVFYGMSCPTERLCVGVGAAADPPEGQGSAGLIAASRTPDAGVRAWKSSDWKVVRLFEKNGYVPNFRDVSCPSPRFCVAVANKGRIFTTRHPLHGASAWKATRIPNIGSLRFVSCPRHDLCVVLAYRGQILTATEPAGGTDAWRRTDVSELAGPSNPFGTPAGLACPSTQFCAAADNGSVYVSTDPATGAWAIGKTFEPPGPGFSAFGCASDSVCLGGGFAAIRASTSPGDSTGAWTELPVGEESAYAIDCPTSSYCAATFSPGEVWASTSPATGPWLRSRRFRLRDASLRALSCSAPEVCVAGGRNGLIVASY